MSPLKKTYVIDPAGVRRLVVERVEPAAPVVVVPADEATAKRVSRAAAAKPVTKTSKSKPVVREPLDELAESEKAGQK